MDASQLPGQPLKTSINWLSLIQLVLSALAALLLIGTSLIILTTDLVQRSIQGSKLSDPTSSAMIAASLAFAGALSLPSAWYAWKRLADPAYQPAPRPERRNYGFMLTITVLILVVGALVLGNWASKDARLSWWLLPPLNLIATGLPALWLIYIGTRGLLPPSPSRKWGVFFSGLVLGPLIILIIELFVLIGMGILALFWVMLDPGLSGQLNDLAFRIQNAGPNPEALLQILLPFLLNPVILILVFAFFSVIVPMIEEALKPIGVWFLVRQRITPAQGFGFGVLSGMGFGLFENLGNTSNGGEAWALLASTRVSTLLLHGLTAGLIGWALASAWSQRRTLRLGVTYILAVLLHGLWNGLAVLGFFSSLEGQSGISIPTFLKQVGSVSAIGIVILGAFNLVIYFGFSARLRRNLSESTPKIIDTPDPDKASQQPSSSDFSPSSAQADDDSSPLIGEDHTSLDEPNLPDNGEIDA